MSSSRKWFPGSGAVQLTEGPIARQLVGFAVPLFLGSLIQQLYSTVDLMFVGKLIGRDASAAVGSSGLMVTCIVGFFTGLSVGVGVVAGQAAGRRDEQALRRIIHTAAGFTALMALVFLILGQLMVVPVLKAMHTPEDIMTQAMVYIRIYLFSLPAIVTYNVGTGVIRALGNSRAPTLYQLIGGIGNVIVNTLFIALLKWGVQGAALATVCTQTLAAGLVLRHLCSLAAPYRLQFRRVRVEWDVCRKILSVGIPAAIQSIVITLSNVVVQANINLLGVESIAAFTAYFKVENFIYFPIMAFGAACSTFISQNVGAGQIDRAKRGVGLSIAMGVSVTAVLATLGLLLGRTLFGLFSSDEEVIRLGLTIIRVTFPLYFFYVFLESFGGAIRGAGKALPTMLIILVNMCGVRLGTLKLIMAKSPVVGSVAWVYPITWICTSLCLFIYYKTDRWVPGKE
jgi:putative MATE family efflux protein